MLPSLIFSLAPQCPPHFFILESPLLAHISFVVNRTFNAMSTQRLQQHPHPPFLQRTAMIKRSFCEGFTQHDLHILVTAPLCCDRKARAACAQSFTLWQQATIEFTCHDHHRRTGRHFPGGGAEKNCPENNSLP